MFGVPRFTVPATSAERFVTLRPRECELEAETDGVTVMPVVDDEIDGERRDGLSVEADDDDEGENTPPFIAVPAVGVMIPFIV